MTMAIEMATEALEAGEVPIGCVIVSADNEVLSRGRNRTNELKNATIHAEFDALRPLLPRGKPSSHLEEETRRLLSGCKLYVTVEPCIMCAAALRKCGLVEVYFGCFNERFGGCGSIIPAHTDYIKHAVDPPLQISQLEAYKGECIMTLRRFYLKENERAPVPRKKAKRVLKPIT